MVGEEDQRLPAGRHLDRAEHDPLAGQLLARGTRSSAGPSSRSPIRLESAFTVYVGAGQRRRAAPRRTSRRAARAAAQHDVAAGRSGHRDVHRRQVAHRLAERDASPSASGGGPSPRERVGGPGARAPARAAGRRPPRRSTGPPTGPVRPAPSHRHGRRPAHPRPPRGRRPRRPHPAPVTDTDTAWETVNVDAAERRLEDCRRVVVAHQPVGQRGCGPVERSGAWHAEMCRARAAVVLDGGQWPRRRPP